MENVTENHNLLTMFTIYLENEMWCAAYISKCTGSQNVIGDIIYVNNFTEV